MKVGVIDTGVDYNYPDLKDFFKSGYDFVDNETTYKNWKDCGEAEYNTGGFSYFTYTELKN
ncbi:hypothetical protein JOC86_003788 [Bacillus pakistanensis]|uniref:Peptidase S8/S53 domain-containing protein n=1 Tax=Rossellomorea pakistanensis TaxID=992288 RepID=A0ABS2NHC7_9BACI|nr:hypothetical protein [Bacillus pakistanensis]